MLLQDICYVPSATAPRYLRHAEVTHLSFFDQIGDSSYHIFHRNAIIQSARLIKINGLYTQTHQRIVDEILNGNGTQVQSQPLTTVKDRAKLDTDEGIVSSAFDGFAYKQFIVAAAVKSPVFRKLMPLSNAIWMVAILSLSSCAGPTPNG
jgi:hypothetical protein